MGVRLAWVAIILLLRVFAQPAGSAPTLDAPPPPVEDRLAAADSDTADAPADDPSDLDDDDDDSDDVALPARIVAATPPAVELRPTFILRSLHDTHTGEPLFRPPRSASVS